MTTSALPGTLAPASFLPSLRAWAAELGFTGLGVAAIDLAADEAHFLEWLRAGFNGEMGYMSRHGAKRTRPSELIPGTVSCVSVRMDYWPQEAADAEETLHEGSVGYISRYALGRDYHKLLRARLQKLCERIQNAIGSFGYRVFTDSAPVLEKALARNAGLGWIGKHTNLIDRNAGSYFFLGEIYLDFELPPDEPSTAHCGSCSACIPACPTGAIDNWFTVGDAFSLDDQYGWQELPPPPPVALTMTGYPNSSAAVMASATSTSSPLPATRGTPAAAAAARRSLGPSRARSMPATPRPTPIV